MYKYAGLVAAHATKVGFVYAGAKLVANAGVNAAKGLFHAGPTAGAGVTGRLANVAGKWGPAALAVGGSVSNMGGRPNGPRVFGMGMPGMPRQDAQMAKGPSQAGFKLGSVVEEIAKLHLVKSALDASSAINLGSYGAFGLGTALHHSHPRLATGLEAAGLAGLAGTSAHDAYKSHQGGGSPAPGLKDLLGLALMGSALYDRSKTPHSP
jgi:hypothetical protein